MTIVKKAFMSIVGAGALAQLLLTAAPVAAEEYSIKDGVLKRPTGYREWIYVGTPGQQSIV
jgi:hypothetical protein